MSDKKKIEQGKVFIPQFNDNGLIPVIAQDINTNEILMLAYMNREALDLTIKTGSAVYYSRSRQRLWKKGEQSGHVQKVKKILVDCDQDCLVLKVEVDQGQCHTGYKSCFYRALIPTQTDTLEFIAERAFDPDEVYG